MPPSNDIRQLQDIRLWKRSARMDRRSTLQSAGRDVETGSFSSRRLRVRWLASRDRDGDGDGGSGRGGQRNFQEFADGPGDVGESGDSSGDDLSGDDLSDDDSDVENDGNAPQRTVPTATSSSGSIVTLTALPPSKATTSLSDVLTTLTPQIATPAPSPPNIIKLPGSPTTTSPFIGFPTPTDQRKEEGSASTTIVSSITSQTQPSLPTLPTTTTPLQIVSETTSSMTERPTPTSDFSMDNNNDNNNGDGQKHKGHGDKDNNNNRGLDATAEHLLIAAGAIGAFILFCFIGWIVYRVLKRPKNGGSGFGFIDKLSRRRKVPMEGTWDGRTLYMANEAPPIYEKGEYATTMSGNFFAPGKAYPPGPGSVARSVASNSETGTLRRPLNGNLAPASMMDQYAENDASSINNNVNLTLRSQMTQMSQPYYNESDMPRQPPGPGNRASQLSSISSGFGDGDIIIPPPLAVQKPLPDPNSGTPNADGAARDNAAATRDSWVSRDGERRETIYTTTSEDRPARFRSISSWVNQQAGRAKRAGSRARERGEVPVMPAVPGEINMTRQTAYR